MSIDTLHTRIRKTKNPSVIDFTLLPEHIPLTIMQETGGFVRAYGRFCLELLEGLRDIVPAVRFSLMPMSFMGNDGLMMLSKILHNAKRLGYYVFLDIPGVMEPMTAQLQADLLFREDSILEFDAIIVNSYIAEDGYMPYIQPASDSGKSIFVAIRTANASAFRQQDLFTGSRVVHMMVADQALYLGEKLTCKCGYSLIGGVGAATSPDSLRTLRSTYTKMFLFVDGYDLPSANAKNCSFAFDRLGFGAIVCAGVSVTAAWQKEFEGESNYIQFAIEAANRMKKNICRYVTVL